MGVTHKPKSGAKLTGTEYEAADSHVLVIADDDIPSSIARDSEVTAAVAAEATLARNADNLTSGTVADARIASTIARDSEVSSAITTHAGATDPHGDRSYADSAVGTHASDTTSVHGIADTSALATASDVSSAISALSGVYQPLDSDLTSIAGVSTQAFGRSLLGLSDAAALHAASNASRYVPAGSSSGHASAVAAGVALQAAIDALPSGGGLICLGSGYFSWASGGPDLGGKTGVRLLGVGSLTAGADGATVIEHTGTGSGSFLDVGDSIGCSVEGAMVRYTDTGFTGVLVDQRGSGSSFTDGFAMRNCVLWGSHAEGQTARLVAMNKTYASVFDHVFFNGGGVQVEGRRSFEISAVATGNPSSITAAGHGLTTGDRVSIGGTTTTPTILGSAAELVVTVTDDDHFTVPVNVASVADGTGYGSCNIRDWSNVIAFRDCEFRNAVIMPIRDAGESWTFDACNYEGLASGDVGAYSHTPGVLAKAVAWRNCWMGDQTTTNAGAWIAWGGYGLDVVANRIGGRAVSNVTAVRFDEDNCDGFTIAGNALEQMYAVLDFGTTTGNPHGVVLGNRFGPSGVVGGGSGIIGTIPRGLGLFGSAVGTAADGYVFSGAATATVLRFDGDTSAQIYRNSSALLQVTGGLYATGQVKTQSASAACLMSNQGFWQGAGSNTNHDVGMDAKGTGVVRFGINAGTGGVQISPAAGKVGFYGTTPIVRPEVTGSRGSNAALASLLTALAALGLVTDSSS